MKKKILVVDNDPLIVEFITGLLERKGHEVVAAEDGISALDILTSFVPDIMFIDLIMPRISGEKLCRIVRSMPHLNNCYLVIVSATVAEQAPDCSKVGADAYIAKGSYSTMGDHILAAVNGADDFSGERKPIMGLDDVHPRQMTKELLSQNRHLETMLESLSEGILEVYSERVVYANSAAVSLLGFDQKKILGSYPLDLFDKFARQRVEALLKSGTDKSDEIGKDIPVEINGRRVDMKALSLKEDASTTILVMRDVTEQKQTEEEKKRLEAQLQRAQKMEAIGTLAGGVAHDLNNVLSAIVGYPDLLLMQIPEDSPLRKPILILQDSGKKAATIVQDMLTLARRGVVTDAVVNLNDIISEYLKSPVHEKVKLYHPGVEVESNLGPDLLNITGSAMHFTQTIMNLVSNAAEAMTDGGKIFISTENRYIDRPISGYDSIEEGDYITLAVSDTGTGISSEDMERIFEPFYTKKKMGRSGTGLGMSVVWGTIKDHNGYIDVQSTEGKGTTFTLYFPATRQEIAEDKAQLSIEEYMGKGESILVVDDVKAQLEMAFTILTTLGYAADTVSSGEDAVEYLKEHTVDLVILDMIMDPGIDGLDTYKKILEVLPGQKTIVASGFSETDRVRDAQKLGAGAYVKKPYTLEKIGLAVKAELEK